MNPDLPWLEEELTAHSQWVRRLARSLVHDETAAEDLVQDTWVAALSRPPSDRRALRGWLGRVVRTLAWKRQRRASTAPIAGDEGEIPEGAPESDLVERLELHRRLANELRALREPLRTTLLQRYFESLSAAQIAERTGVPAPTVRWRLQQGLAELRVRLDARFGGERETWMSALAFAFPSKGTVLAGSGVAIGEGVLMSMLVKISLGVAALVAAVLLVLPMVVKKDVPSHVPALADNSVHPLEAASDAPLKPNESLVTESAGPERAAVAEEAKLAAATEGQTRVVARILDEKLRPIANAWLCGEGSENEPGKEDSRIEARTANDGIAKLNWEGRPPTYGVALSAGADHFATIRPNGTLAEGSTLDLGDLLLHPGGSVHGRVVDAEQRPVSGAEVVVALGQNAGDVADVELLRNRGPSITGRALSGKSAQDGSFLVAGVPVGTTRAWAKSGNLRWAMSDQIEIGAGREAGEILLVIEKSESSDPELADVEGVVLGPDGKPIAKPCMDANQKTPNCSRGGYMVGEEDGSFRIQPTMRGGDFELEVWDPGVRFMRAVVSGIKPGTKGIEVRLKEAKTLVLTVKDERGPVEHFSVLWGPNECPTGDRLDRDELHVDGHTTLRVPSESFWYHVQAPGYRNEKLGPIDGRSSPATLTLEMQVSPGVRGRVMDGDKPVSGAHLSLCEQPLDYRAGIDGFATLVASGGVVWASSREDGSFALDLEKDGRFSVLVEADGYALAQFGPVEVLAAKGLSDVIIPMDSGGTLEGTVLMPAGHGTAGVVVGINRGDGRPLRQTVGPDGQFRFVHLTAGPWEIQRTQPVGGMVFLMVSIGSSDVEALRRDLTIAVGQTTHRDLDLREEASCVLEIDLRNNAAPARAWTISATPKNLGASWGLLPSVATDSNGHARLQTPFVGECTLTITPPAESASSYQFRADLTLHRGSDSWIQDIKTGRVEGVITGWKPDQGIEWRIQSETEFSEHVLRPDATGKLVEPIVGVGKVAVLRWKGGGVGASPETVQTFELAAGETKALQLP